MTLTTTSENNTQYSLQNIDNYKLTMPLSSNDILARYKLLVREYLNFITDSINITNNIYNSFIIMRGLDIITNVYTIILFYSKNIDMASYHGQKSFYFYLEFIGQISEVQHTFLQLSSRDAVMFVYKKTIFEINNDIRKKHKVSLDINNNSLKLDMLDANISIMKNIINYIISSYDFSKESTKGNLKLIIKRIDNISEKLNNSKITMDHIHIIQLFVESMNITGMSNDLFCDNIEQFIKKYTKENITETKFKNKMIDPDYVKYALDCSEKFITWIFSK